MRNEFTFTAKWSVVNGVCWLCFLQDTVALLQDPSIQAYLPMGPMIAVFTRAAALLCVRVETVLILIVQHMVDDWQRYIGSSSKGRAPSILSSPVSLLCAVSDCAD